MLIVINTKAVIKMYRTVLVDTYYCILLCTDWRKSFIWWRNFTNILYISCWWNLSGTLIQR